MNKYIIIILSAVLGTLNLYAGNGDRTFHINKNLTLYNTLMRELDLFYVDTLDYDRLTRNAVDYMLHGLDPYTVYMPEEESEDIRMMTKGEYGGIGSMIVKNGDDVCIAEPYEGMPAQVHGLRAGDVILEVDGRSAEGLSVAEVSDLLRGTPSTEIRLKVRRPGERKPVEKTFLREKIQLHPIAYAGAVARQTGYVLLADFTDRATLELRAAVERMVAEDSIQSLVIDLRGNGGGLIDEAVKILGLFLPKGTEVVTTRGKGQQAERAYKTPTEPLYPDMRLAVLVDRASASASEILAGAIQDLDRGVVAGERTFGKGLVQNIRPVGYGGYLKVTTAKYYIPSGRCIQAIDYSHRNEDGSVGRVPDSLTTVYHTQAGRPVRDGGGITPDTITARERTMNVAHHILLQNHYFNYATDYVLRHPSIAPAAEFRLTDEELDDFTRYLTEHGFTYTTQTAKYFDELLEIARYEGLDKQAADEIEALRHKLIPDIDRDLRDNRDDIADLLAVEIVKRYYYQRGEIEYTLRDDSELQAAVGLLRDTEAYRDLLRPKAVQDVER